MEKWCFNLYLLEVNIAVRIAKMSLIRRITILNRFNSVSRIRNTKIGNNFQSRGTFPLLHQHRRYLATESKITIDGISKVLRTPENAAFVPMRYRKFSFDSEYAIF